ncbi:type II toxin-antitoxin system PemK/MazF family toxin [bacterium]|nr:type II toxin-antitoxin system PemK/MazF family toxin [bacterium]
MVRKYIPQRGDIVWLSFTPQAGHEQKGRRPAAVVSPGEYNAKVGLALFCPITSSVKGYPFEVNIPEGCEISGVILADQIKSLDFTAREVEFVFHLPVKTVYELLGKLRALVI